MKKYPYRTTIGLFTIDSIYAEKVSTLDSAYSLSNVCIDGFFLNSPFKDSLATLAEEYIESIDGNKQTLIINKLKMWLRNDALLSGILDDNLYDGLDFGEIIANMPVAKVFMKKYLKDPHQYWGSLDANQSCKLYYDVTVYVLTLNREERLMFLKQYFDTAFKVSLKESKQI